MKMAATSVKFNGSLSEGRTDSPPSRKIPTIDECNVISHFPHFNYESSTLKFTPFMHADQEREYTIYVTLILQKNSLDELKHSEA
jgi:hypothetical protein